jgi:hypothetical protein
MNRFDSFFFRQHWVTYYSANVHRGLVAEMKSIQKGGRPGERIVQTDGRGFLLLVV